MQQQFRINPDVIETDLGDELVLLSPKTQGMFSLGAVGRVIWRALPNGLESAIGQVVSEFNVDKATAQTDALELIEQLRLEGLIE